MAGCRYSSGTVRNASLSASQNETVSVLVVPRKAPEISLSGLLRSHTQPQTNHCDSDWADLVHSSAHEARPLGLKSGEG